MSLPLWISHGEEWLALEKVSFNGVTKRIRVNAGVTSLDIRADLYSAWVRWFSRLENTLYLPAMRFTGLDPIPGGFTGDTYFLINGWKLEYDANVVGITGVLYSDDYATPFWSAADNPVFPASVAALVNSVSVTENVVTGDLQNLLPYLALINAGVQKASILVPHTDDIDADAPPPVGDIPDVYLLETETPDPDSNLVWDSGEF